MSKFTRLFFIAVAVSTLIGTGTIQAQSTTDSIITALKTIDPEILQYFPRWRVCEGDLQVKIKQSFALLGYDPKNLDDKNIVVTSAPIREGLSEPEFDLILIECGSERMVAAEISSNMRKLSFTLSDPKRPYCYTEIPPSQPPSAPQTAEIINYMEPTNVTHAFTLSAFEQVLKIGKSGFWLKSSIGTDQVGYTYWSSGEGRITLQRPLYENTDAATRKAIPYLLNAKLGFGYRLNGSIDGQNRFLNFIPGRKLNAGYGGKFVAGLDFHFPMHPQFGVGLNMELPLRGISYTENIDASTYYTTSIGNRRITAPGYPVDPYATAALLRSTGQATVFYNWWVDPKAPENFFRFDLGIVYSEVREVGVFNDTTTGNSSLAIEGVTGLTTWKPNELGDWVYAKIEYKSQSSFPFGVSLQYANQMLLGRAYVPLLGDWLYLEGRYSTPLRGVRPFEMKNFFMFSPVLRLNF
ncbi:MAG: hypothetical protein HQ472_04960 [Ignavibacteria bacterium]|nr:hypothetical protein [Ignavibacteria bacterium]